MTTLEQFAARKLSALEVRLLEAGIVVTLSYTDAGIVVTGEPADRVLARKVLREIGAVVV